MKIKGNVLLARAAFVRKHFGEEAWGRVLASFPDRERKTFGDLLAPASWYPFETGQRLDEAIVRVLGNGDASVFERLGAASARENLSGVHRSFVERETPQGFMSKAPMIHRFYYDSGRCEYEEIGPNACALSSRDVDAYSAVDCLTWLGYFREALRMCGAADVVAREESCRARGAAVCRFVFSWS